MKPIKHLFKEVHKLDQGLHGLLPQGPEMTTMLLSLWFVVISIKGLGKHFLEDVCSLDHRRHLLQTHVLKVTSRPGTL